MNRPESTSEPIASEETQGSRLSPPPRLPTTAAPRRRSDRGRGTGLLGLSVLVGLGAVAVFVIFGLPRLAERARSNGEEESAVESSVGEATSVEAVGPTAVGSGEGGESARPATPGDPPGSSDLSPPAPVDAERADAERAVAAELARAREALEAGDAYAAERAYLRVLERVPEHPEARRGLARAQDLDRLRGLVAEADAAQQAGRTEEARRLYREALQLDGSSEGARQGLARLNARTADARFRAAISQALDALDEGSLEDARAASDRAAGLRPEAPEVADLQRRIERETQARRLRELEERARRAEQEERWQEAAEAWTELAEIDPMLSSARAGQSRSRERASLDRRLTVHVERPDRLSDPAVWNEARDVLAAAREIPDPGPRLETQLEGLEALVRTMGETVPVVLVSDGETEVTVYRVGRLGTFSRRELELRPGSYTVFGTREGFRDVRRQLVVAPGEAVSLDVRCEERVG